MACIQERLLIKTYDVARVRYCVSMNTPGYKCLSRTKLLNGIDFKKEKFKKIVFRVFFDIHFHSAICRSISHSNTELIDQFETKEDQMYQQPKENPISQIETKESKEPVLPAVEFPRWGIKQPGL